MRWPKFNRYRQKPVVTYTCPWPRCGCVFERAVVFTGGSKFATGGQADGVSTAVTCPNCGNGVKTWTE